MGSTTSPDENSSGDSCQGQMPPFGEQWWFLTIRVIRLGCWSSHWMGVTTQAATLQWFHAQTMWTSLFCPQKVVLLKHRYSSLYAVRSVTLLNKAIHPFFAHKH